MNTEPYGSTGVMDGALGHIKIDCTVRSLGGTLVRPALPTRDEWDAMLDKYAPGCGVLTKVAGTNGGKMRCGGKLKWLTGEVTQEFCPSCTEAINKAKGTT